MSNKGNQYKVGLLTIVSITLFVAALLALGILNSFKPKYTFMTVVETSVQGLEKGAKVKYKGVPIGKVDKIQITADGKNIIIYMQIDPSKVARQLSGADVEGKTPDEQFKSFLQDKVDQGLRCQLRYGGITGNLYIEIGLYDPGKYPAKKYALPPSHPPYLPSVPPVLIENIMGKMQEAMEKVAAIDINKMVAEMERTMEHINATLNDINKAINDAKIGEISKSTRQFLETSENAIDEVASLRASVDRSLKNADELMNSIKELVDYLDEHPAALIQGRREKPVLEQ